MDCYQAINTITDHTVFFNKEQITRSILLFFRTNNVDNAEL